MYPQILQRRTSKFYCTFAVVLAQQVDVDIVADFQNAWSNFVETGQIWAFLVGIGIGWWIRSVMP